MIRIDGSHGEGGGQILRTSLALSLITGTPFQMQRIRAGREKPGLRRQHLAAVNAATMVGGAEVEGAELDSQELVFRPGHVRPGEYRFAVGTAGSATLVLQTILPSLLTASGASTLELEGGTHNPMAPPFNFLQRAFLPLLERMGARVTADLERPGFYPAGGGLVTVMIESIPKLEPIDLHERGEILARRICAAVAGLPRHIAEREAKAALAATGWPSHCTHVHEFPAQYGPGNVVTLELGCENVTEVFTGFGERGVTAEKVATRAAREAVRYEQSGAPVGEHLADQLLVPLALAGGGSFVTVAPSPHTLTNIDAIQRFLEVRIKTHEVENGRWRIDIG